MNKSDETNIDNTILGWNETFEKEFNSIKKENHIPCRVVREEKGHYVIQNCNNTYIAKISGKYRFNADSIDEFPTVGDWVIAQLYNNAIIYSLLTRKSTFSRKSSISGGRKVRDINNRKVILGGATDEQVLAANIDYIFVVTTADKNFNIKRIERYLLIAFNSGAVPILIINKSDKCKDIKPYIEVIEQIPNKVIYHFISALNNEGIMDIKTYIKTGVTVGLFGSSGVGKTTIINCLLNEKRLNTQETRSKDDKGRHTTTWRELVLIPTGGILIDTPGMRELQVWSDKDNLDEVFDDIKKLESKCKFSDCSHTKEPLCAIQYALIKGTLNQKRYDNYLVLKSEVLYLEERIKDNKSSTKKEILREKINNKKTNYK